jgi:hypothetical protein
MKVTFDIPDAQVIRIKDWISDTYFQPDDAIVPTPPPPTDAELLAEFKRQVREFIKDRVQNYELLKEHEVIFQQYTPIEVTEE